MLSSLLFAATLLVASPDDESLGGPRGPRLLDLSEDQRAALRGVRDEHGEARSAAQVAVAEARDALRAAASQPGASDGALRDASARLGTALGELSVVRGRQRDAARSQLSGEQRATLDEQSARRKDVRDAVKALREGRPSKGRPGSPGAGLRGGRAAGPGADRGPGRVQGRGQMRGRARGLGRGAGPGTAPAPRER
jgi:Spy/CpxP family protein refolding chaperone